MGCGTWLLTCTCRTCDRIDCHILLQQVQVGRRQQGHLDTSGEAAGISHMLGLCNLLFVDLRQTINIVVTAFDAEILCSAQTLGGAAAPLTQGHLPVRCENSVVYNL